MPANPHPAHEACYKTCPALCLLLAPFSTRLLWVSEVSPSGVLPLKHCLSLKIRLLVSHTLLERNGKGKPPGAATTAHRENNKRPRFQGDLCSCTSLRWQQKRAALPACAWPLSVAVHLLEGGRAPAGRGAWLGPSWLTLQLQVLHRSQVARREGCSPQQKALPCALLIKGSAGGEGTTGSS